MKKILFSLALIPAVAASIAAPAKRPLNHDDFNSWESVALNAISNSGQWSAFSVSPQEGDATLTLRNNKTRKEIIIPRGYRPAFTADGKWALALIKPFYDATRQAKIDKKKDYEMPKDSLAIIDLSTGRVEKIADVLNFKIGEKGGNFFAYQSCDTLYIKPADLKEKENGRPLILRSLTSPATKTVKWVKDYAFSKDGNHLSLQLKKNEKDSLTTSGVALINLPDTSLILFDRDKKHYSLPVFNEAGSAVAYTASNDTVESGTRHDNLYYLPIAEMLAGYEPRNIEVQFTTGNPVNLALPHSSDPEEQKILEAERAKAIAETAGDRLLINQYSTPSFSLNGRFLIIGVAPVVAPDDTTLVDFELPSLDIWRWDAPYTPPQEKSNLSKLREKTLPVVIDLQNGFNQQLLTKKMLATVEPSFGWNSEWALIHDPEEKMISRQWNYLAPENLMAVNVANGKTVKIGEANNEASELSPDGKYVVYYKDNNYYSHNLLTNKIVCLTEAIPYPLWDEDDDHPMTPEAYGIAGWGEKDNRILVYDRYDIWALDLNGVEAPLNLTSDYGRKNNLRLRYNRLDKEKGGIDVGDLMVLDVLDFNNQKRGYATMKYAAKGATPKVQVLDNYKLTRLNKAKDADVFVWQKANFETVPDLWTTTGTDFSKAQKLTSSNPQMKDISWGTAQLVEWYAYNGRKTKGVLYLPEGFDPNEGSWPMLSVFYERNAEELYMHYTMEPSWSWVNYPFYVSRGYVVFVPDIYYDTPGIPGESAYNYVCSGVEEMLKRYPSIDPKRLGIDGQSWGGYQTAYLVTRTNMFACAGSGAPVANMTSAYGGIRWGTGDSRQAQYEMGQSRIGRTLWEAPELYIANSPVFHADRVQTPLLIMHNDADGAVPWYQGIEMFMALRRLEKPVWMLQYNGEAHNLKERRNRKDITKRLQQFFDHYLKGDPMPRWMKEGISPLRKGQDFGF